MKHTRETVYDLGTAANYQYVPSYCISNIKIDFGAVMLGTYISRRDRKG